MVTHPSLPSDTQLMFFFYFLGLLWRHFKTCGVEKWDIELRELVTHYRNWQEWAHKVVSD